MSKRNSWTAVPKRFIVDSRGRKTAVLLPIKNYEKLMEDLHDLAIVAERRAEATVASDEMKRRLRKHGLL